MSHHLFLVSKTLSLPATYNLYPGEGAGQASLQVKMTSVNAHFDDWEPPLPPPEFQRDPRRRAPLPPRGLQSPLKGFPWRGSPSSYSPSHAGPLPLPPLAPV